MFCTVSPYAFQMSIWSPEKEEKKKTRTTKEKIIYIVFCVYLCGEYFIFDYKYKLLASVCVMLLRECKWSWVKIEFWKDCRRTLSLSRTAEMLEEWREKLWILMWCKWLCAVLYTYIGFGSCHHMPECDWITPAIIFRRLFQHIFNKWMPRYQKFLLCLWFALRLCIYVCCVRVLECSFGSPFFHSTIHSFHSYVPRSSFFR